MRVALDHLVALGHRHIGYVSAMLSQESQHGPTMRALRAYANAARTELDLPRLDYRADHDLRHIRLMTTNLLHEHPEITGLVTMREMVETALFSAVHDAGMRVPDDISVLGLTDAAGSGADEPGTDGDGVPGMVNGLPGVRMMIDELEGVDTDRQGDPLGSDLDRACEHVPGAVRTDREVDAAPCRTPFVLSPTRVPRFLVCSCRHRSNHRHPTRDPN